MSLDNNKSWKKKLGNIILLLTAWSLIQGVAASGFMMYGKLMNRLKVIKENYTKITRLFERIDELELELEKQSKSITYLKGKAFGFEKVMRKEMEESPKRKRKKRKRIIGIF